MTFPPTIDPPKLPELPSSETLLRWADSTPFGYAGFVGVIGILLLFGGARLYKLALMAPGIVAGLFLGSLINELMDPTTAIIVSVTLALTGALVCYFLERFAIRGIGFVIMAIGVNAAWPLLQSGSAPWWIILVAGVIGALTFPYIFKFILRLVTAALGASVLAYAAGFADNLLLIGCLTAAGFAVQVVDGLIGKRKKSSSKEDPDD